MTSREMLIPQHIANMFILLAFDYSLPINIHVGETIVLAQKGHRHRSILRKVLLEYEETNEDYVDAAMVILNLQ